MHSLSDVTDVDTVYYILQIMCTSGKVEEAITKGSITGTQSQNKEEINNQPLKLAFIFNFGKINYRL